MTAGALSQDGSRCFIFMPSSPLTGVSVKRRATEDPWRWDVRVHELRSSRWRYSLQDEPHARSSL